MIKPTLEEIKLVLKSKKYTYYNGPKPFDINIIGIRTADRTHNKFNDFITFSGRDDRGHEFLKIFDGTTDPGLYWLKNPMQVKGTAILVPGQYKKVYKIGTHGQGASAYTAFEQIAAMCYCRDNNKDSRLDIDELMLNKDNFIFDNIKSNLHRAGARVKSTQVDKWSAACQVVADPDEFDQGIEIGIKGSVNYGNFFTYTLIEEKDFKNI